MNHYSSQNLTNVRYAHMRVLARIVRSPNISVNSNSFSTSCFFQIARIVIFVKSKLVVSQVFKSMITRSIENKFNLILLSTPQKMNFKKQKKKGIILEVMLFT